MFAAAPPTAVRPMRVQTSQRHARELWHHERKHAPPDDLRLERQHAMHEVVDAAQILRPVVQEQELTAAPPMPRTTLARGAKTLGLRARPPASPPA